MKAQRDTSINLKRPTKSVSWLTALCFLICFVSVQASARADKFKVIAFYTAKSDLAHISFVRESNTWFPKMGEKYHFKYESTSNWDNLNAGFLSGYQIVVFLDTRPETALQRAAFQEFMDKGGAWMGFHFSAFALSPSAYAQNWNWYHNEFLGSGEYASNTWRPTAATLKVESKHTSTRHLPKTFKSSPNEWYRWEKDLRLNSKIKILLSTHPSSFPLDTGPMQHEIWHSGYYPVAWTNTNYKMIYLNGGHNDMDYEHKTNKALSSTFSEEAQSRFIIDALLWLGHPDNRKNKINQ